LVDVEAFDSTAIVVPNIGGPPNSFFWMRPRAEWKDLFVEFLKAPHETIPEEEAE
jgi:hypothetical protein